MKTEMILILFILLVIMTRVFCHPSLDNDITQSYGAAQDFPFTNKTEYTFEKSLYDPQITSPDNIREYTSATFYLRCTISNYIPYRCSGSGSIRYTMHYYGYKAGTLTLMMKFNQTITQTSYSLEVDLESNLDVIARKDRNQIIIEQPSNPYIVT